MMMNEDDDDEDDDDDGDEGNHDISYDSSHEPNKACQERNYA